MSSSVCDLHPHAAVLGHRQQVVDDVEPLGPLRIVDAAEVDQLVELAVRMVAQEGQGLDDRGRLGAVSVSSPKAT